MTLGAHSGRGRPRQRCEKAAAVALALGVTATVLGERRGEAAAVLGAYNDAR